MNSFPTYPRRLIEVDLPIAEISAHARDGRSVHHGHITAIHIWWARKPLPSCRAATLAAFLPDPGDPACPAEFRDVATESLRPLYGHVANDREELRRSLLRFVSDFASWRRAGDKVFLDVARELTTAAHRSLVSDAGVPFFADPFCGGGSVPLEALRLGSTTYASDLNPVAALISKVTLEYVQRWGDQLLVAVEREGARIEGLLRDAMASYYPAEPDHTPSAYLSFRRMRCEGPQCGADVVLTSKFHLSRRGSRTIGLRHAGWRGSTPNFEIAEGKLDSFPTPTVRRGAATCLRCGYTHPVERVRERLTAQVGGAPNALLVAVATTDPEGKRVFRLPTDADRSAIEQANIAVAGLEDVAHEGLTALPNEPLPPIGTLGFRVQRYGMTRWRDLFTPRQLLTITTLTEAVRETMSTDTERDGLGMAVRASLALAVDRVCDYQNTGCSWNPSGSALPHLFTRQALPIIWDYGEANPLGSSSGSWLGAVAHVARGLRNARVADLPADVGLASASRHPLPTDCAHLVITDPPYYDAIPYADLSDFFYVWLRRMLAADHPSLFSAELAPRDEECVVNTVAGKDSAYYRRVMTEALAEARRVTRPDGIAVIIFAHKSTAGWEDLLAAMLDAGWIITASWPIDTENAGRLRARNSAVLASSIHLVCRPREHVDGSLVTDTVGDWRDVLAALPARIRDWLPRLAGEGIVGADAIFACLGPALELFSRYARVEKVSGEQVELSEYLEHVWAAIAREALSTIFEEADTSGLEPDARLTAMWLWTLAVSAADSDPDDLEDRKAARSGFYLEFDAARKIAQGLGARLEELSSVVEVKSGKARLLPVSERQKSLLAGAEAIATPNAQGDLFGPQTELNSDPGQIEVGNTVLDQLHQAMLLFAAGKMATLRGFLAEVGQEARFWRLAQALSALYPPASDEKRWVDGVSGLKKGVGAL